MHWTSCKDFTPGWAIIMSSSESSIIKGLASLDDNSFVLFLAAGLENASEMEGCFGSTENVNKMMKWKEQNMKSTYPFDSIPRKNTNLIFYLYVILEK